MQATSRLPRGYWGPDSVCPKHPQAKIVHRQKKRTGSGVWRCLECERISQSNRYSKHRESGKCISCNSPALAGQLCCERHAKGNAENRTRSRLERKRAAFLALGGKCAQCGETDWCVLQIDHINGDGAQERREFGSSTSYTQYWWDSESATDGFLENIHKYQLLCANCHVRKTKENGENMSRLRWGVIRGCDFNAT